MLFIIWRRNTAGGCSRTWTRTAHSVMADNQFAAQKRVQRKFANSGFTAMQLVAVEDGDDPNDTDWGTVPTGGK